MWTTKNHFRCCTKKKRIQVNSIKAYRRIESEDCRRLKSSLSKENVKCSDFDFLQSFLLFVDSFFVSWKLIQIQSDTMILTYHSTQHALWLYPIFRQKYSRGETVVRSMGIRNWIRWQGFDCGTSNDSSDS